MFGCNGDESGALTRRSSSLPSLLIFIAIHGSFSASIGNEITARARYPRESGILGPPNCSETRTLKFYVYEFQGLEHCLPRDKQGKIRLLEKVLLLEPGEKARLGPSLFFEQQLLNHPWRTTNPSEAALFVVPSVLDLSANGLCDVGNPEPRNMAARLGSSSAFRRRVVAVATHLAENVRASPWYHRLQGRDHMMLFTHYRVRGFLFGRTLIPGVEEFRNTIQNFVLGIKHARRVVAHNRFWSFPLPQTCVVTIPLLAPSALDRCSVEGDGGNSRFICPQSITESTFDEYLQRRNHTIYFSGNTAREATPPVRKMTVKHLGPLYPPNILISTTRATKLAVCAMEDGQVPQPAPCKLDGHLPEAQFQRFMASSRFSVHCKGDDAGSARVQEAFDTGTIQLFLADRYYEDIAAFKCQVKWNKVVHAIQERRFVRDPLGVMKQAIDQLSVNDYEGMREIWELQRQASVDVLWHVPDSRVAHNTIEDAIRCLDNR